MVFFLSSLCWSVPKAPTAKEVMAGIAVKLLHFIEWPEKVKRNEWVIGILGGEEEVLYFQEAIGKDVGGRPVQVKALGFELKEEEIVQCHMVYVPSPEKSFKLKISPSISKDVFWVGLGSEFLQRGGHLRLFVNRSKVSFEIHRTQAEKDGFKIRSQLLRLAHKVY